MTSVEADSEAPFACDVFADIFKSKAHHHKHNQYLHCFDFTLQVHFPTTEVSVFAPLINPV